MMMKSQGDSFGFWLRSNAFYMRSKHLAAGISYLGSNDAFGASLEDAGTSPACVI